MASNRLNLTVDICKSCVVKAIGGGQNFFSQIMLNLYLNESPSYWISKWTHRLRNFARLIFCDGSKSGLARAKNKVGYVWKMAKNYQKC